MRGKETILHKLLVVLVICTILSVGCAPAAQRELSVKMGWGGGLSLRSSHIEIDRYGNVGYEVRNYGGQRVRSEKNSAKLTSQQMEELVAAIKWAYVWTVKDEYVDKLCSDCPRIDLTITLDGKSKHISHHGAGCQYGLIFNEAPTALCRLEDTIRTIVNSDQWVYTRPVPQPAPPPTPTP